ncbi:protein of unknown function [Legionella fallonii LLAP-10]|uniref:Uncharacterized protein n=1 Tax=Legionella fallonii LLAP-10 TaxID=1212491 RepID=A0A098G9W6_9GAMM|nr:protein of unknown function [Legionella fallonii LLAP-10]
MILSIKNNEVQCLFRGLNDLILVNSILIIEIKHLFCLITEQNVENKEEPTNNKLVYSEFTKLKGEKVKSYGTVGYHLRSGLCEMDSLFKL